MSVFNTTIRQVIFFMSLLLLSVSCKSDREPMNRVVEHPISELIPHQDRNHIVIERNFSYENLIDPPEGLNLLYSYLENSVRIEYEQLEIMVKDVESLKIEAISHDRVIILDTSNDRLIEYNFFENTSSIIAGFGRGPGELQHAIDITRAGDFIYVARRDMRLSRFNCKTEECAYDKTIVLEVQPISITSTQKGLALTTGAMIRGGEEMVKNSSINFPAIQIVSMDEGKLLNSFGNIYNTQFMMVLERFSRTGMVTYLPKQGHYVWASSWFPFIYFYNDEFELIETYKLENHIQNRFEFYPAEQRRSFSDQDHTKISELKKIENDKVLLVTTTQTNKQEMAGKTVYDYSYDYYVIDHKNQKVAHLGTEDQTSSHQSKIIIDQGNLFKNDGGILYQLNL